MNFSNSLLSSIIDENIGGVDYIIKYGDLYIPYLVIYILAMIIGCTGNLLITSAILLTKELQNTTNMLIFNLSLADFIISAFVNGFTIMGMFVGKRFFDKSFAFCKFIAATCLVTCSSSMVSIGLLSINRYVHICHNGLYKKVFSKNKTILYCFGTWFVGGLVALPCSLGWGDHTFNLNTLNCVWDRMASRSYTFFFPISTIVIPCCCVFICYMKIFFYVRNSKSKVANYDTQKKNYTSQSVHFAKGLFASFLLFTVCWAPYGILVMADWYFTFPASSEMYTMLLAHLNSALNPILYALYNPIFQKGYKNVLKIISECKRNNNSNSTRMGTTAFNGTSNKEKVVYHT